MTVETIGELIELITGYQGAAAILAAQRLGVFTELAASSRTSSDLAARIGVDAGALAALLDALVSIGLLDRRDGDYIATEFVRDELGPGGDLGLVVEKEGFFARAWQDLEQVVRDGRPVLAPWRERLESRPGEARLFLDALDVLARRTGPDLASLPELTPGRRVADVGGGLGSYTRALVEGGSEVVLVELPTVAAWARDALSDLPTGRWNVAEADVVAEGLPAPARGVDAALVSHLLHDLSPEDAVTVCRTLHEALAPGGGIVVNDFARDAGPGSFGPLFDLMMRVETGGAAYAIAELRRFLTDAGFSDVRRADVSAPLTVLVARKA
jgi:SAM-dependent methyltransferase